MPANWYCVWILQEFICVISDIVEKKCEFEKWSMHALESYNNSNIYILYILDPHHICIEHISSGRWRPVIFS